MLACTCAYVQANFDDVLGNITAFLKENKLEFVVMRLKDEVGTAEPLAAAHRCGAGVVWQVTGRMVRAG